MLQTADVGKYVLAIVDATNGWGTSVYGAFAYPAGPIDGRPTATVLPHVSGATQIGATLSTTFGTWVATPDSYRFQWYRCNNDLSTCNAISGANANSYVVQTADVGYKVIGSVAAHNGYGWSANVASDNAIGPFAQPPTISVAPHASGQAQLGGTITTTNGTWSGSPTQYHYKWWRCLGTDPCSTISGATSQSYVVVSADVGYKLFPQVQAYNANGWSDFASSDNSLGPIPGPPVPAPTPLRRT